MKKEKDIRNVIDEYVSLAEQHSSMDSFDPSTTKKMNRIANKILKLADKIYQTGGQDEFKKVLKHENRGVRTWGAFNFIERMKSDQETLKEALDIIEEISKSESIDAPGAELWLKNWNKENGR
jgi:hypothetical protein